MTMRPRRRSSSAPGNVGSASSVSSTLATTPGIRMFPARHTSVGPSATGSTIPSRTRLGSTPDTTVGAASSSPPASATPVTRPPTTVTRSTVTPHRISAPNARAAPASARPTAPEPPCAKAVSPAAPPSFPAESNSRFAAVPADHGPIAAYRIPRTAIAARSASVSNASPTRSATAIGRMRIASRVCPRSPRPRNARASRSPPIASANVGLRTSGGVVAATCARKLATDRTFASNLGYASASALQRAASSDAVRAGSAQSVRPPPSPSGAKARTAGLMNATPCSARRRSRTTVGLNRPTVSASSAAPPGFSRRSSTSVRRPAFAR